jgi:hypothetical protein
VPFQPELLPSSGTRRRQLAQWVTHPQNKAFARAAANRAWAVLFGRPLVEPVDDLAGAESTPPAIDVLANDFATHGFDLRRLFRVIAATEIFQLDSTVENAETSDLETNWAVFPLTRLRPEQVAGAMLQASSVETINADSHILTRFARFMNEREFIQRYGDLGDEEFSARSGTIPQRLLMMNGDLLHERTKEGLMTAAGRIGMLASNDRVAVEAAFLTVLTRRPTTEEAAHFAARLAGTKGDDRGRRMADLFWTLLNTTEFAWNH